jgi:ribonuclease P protein component
MPPAPDAASRFTLPAEKRLKRQNDFRRVYDARCSVANAHLVCYAAANPDTPGTGSRIGMAVSTRLGNAVVRNRYKRLIREAFRLEQHELPAGFDYIFIPRSATGPATLEEYRQSVRDLTARAVRKWRRRPATASERPGGED